MADVHTVAYQDKFTSVPLDAGQKEGKNGKIKVPRKIIHFSDGVVEEYSTDEEDSVDAQPKVVVDPKALTWLPWCRYYVVSAAKMSLGAAELCGEKIAWLFGITSPKYAYAIEEYKRVAKEEAEEKERQNRLKEHANVNSAFDVKVMKDEEKEVSSGPKQDEEAANKY